jgi:arsenate reductase
MTTTIYHNPSCSTSRNTLALIREAGIEPVVIEYLKTPPSHDVLAGLIKKAGLSVREAIRQKEVAYLEHGLDNPDLTDDQLIDAMIETPILINRPIVVTDAGVRLCRPAGTVHEIL